MPECDLDEFLRVNPDWVMHADLVVAPPNLSEVFNWYSDTGGPMLDAIDEPYLVGRFAVTRGAIYCRMRAMGESRNMAEMVAMQTGPGLNTDAVFFSGSKPLYDQFESQSNLNRYLKAAKQHGFTPGKHSTYISSIARFPGDPEAWVDQTQGRGYIKRLMEKRGWACDGAVNVVGREPESDPLAPENCKPLADDIVKIRERKMLQGNPDLARLNRSELRRRIIDKHGAKP